MTWWNGPRSTRKRDLRRTRAERRIPWTRQLARVFPLSFVLWTTLLGLGVAAIVSAGGDALRYRLGDDLNQAVTARTDFSLSNEAETLRREERAASASERIYRLDVELIDDIRTRLTALARLPDAQQATEAEFAARAEQIGITLEPDAAAHLASLRTESARAALTENVDAIIDQLLSQPFVEASEVAARRLSTQSLLLTSAPASDSDLRHALLQGRRLHVNALLVTDVSGLENAADRASRVAHPTLRSVTARLIKTELLPEGGPRPIYLYDDDATQLRGLAARELVEPVIDIFEPGVVIARPGRIDAIVLERLRAEHEAFLHSSEGTFGTGQAWTSNLPRALLASLAAIGLLLHIRSRHRTLPGTLQQHVAMGILLLVLLAAARLTLVSSSSMPLHVVAGLQSLGAGLLIVVYQNRGLAYPAFGTLALLMTLATEGSAAFFLMLLASSTVSMKLLSDIRIRGQIVASGLVAGVTAAILAGLAGAVMQSTSSPLVERMLWAGGSTLAAAFVIEGLLPAVEYLFRVTTSMTLLEWCDNNQPLLRALATDAPGTYNHSLLVGTLSETAAREIDADGLLCRAGAYYHDIGKINKPEYFVENQALHGNRHERLSPAMSLLIIIGHVKDGVEIAKEYRIPQPLRPFIAEHHGTTLVEYFYHAASKSRRPDDPQISDTEYRYPGPKPQTRETAILMLADGVEGAVRAMDEPTPGRIEDTVNSIVEKRLTDGQFDECDLTFREVAVIRSSLIRSLQAIYHTRIKYPSGDSDAAAPEPGVEESTATPAATPTATSSGRRGA